MDALKEYADLDVMAMSDDELEKAVDKHGGVIKGEYIRGLAIDQRF